jgi:hypothetical protein
MGMSIKTILLAGAAVAFSVTAFAQSADTAYCHKLGASYRKLNPKAQTTEGKNAMAQCSSNPSNGIPVLEKLLTNEKVSLPKR